MRQEDVYEVCRCQLGAAPSAVKRFSAGLGSYVYLVCIGTKKYVFRFRKESYAQGLYWLSRLAELELPVSRPIASGQWKEYSFMLVEYLPGKELGEIYPTLTRSDKRNIAREVTELQKKVALLPAPDAPPWPEWVRDMLRRAEDRIRSHPYFEVEKVYRLYEMADLQDYFASIVPVCYLDDISTKNLLIENGHVSGIIDVDWMEPGDPLTFMALTNVSLKNLGYDTEYVEFLLEQRQVTPRQYQAFLFYSLLYCVDFMGERGSSFVGRTVPVNDQIIARLNAIYDDLLQQFMNFQP